VEPVGQRERREEVTRFEDANQKEKCISVRAPMTRGPNGSAREAVAYGEERAGAGELSQLGRIPGED
jgi:hypothetical protein